jgi:hypothetical protein
MFLLLAEAMAAVAEQGMEWDKKAKTWKWKDEDEPAK